MQSILALTALMSAAVHGYAIRRGELPPSYGSASGDLPLSNDTTADTGICGSTSSTNYTVVSGDTVTTIAEQFGSGICDIATANGLSNPNLIELGQVLIVPTNCTTPDNDTCVDRAGDPTWTCVPGPPSTYDVRTNDTLSSIAISFNITLDSLVAVNTQIENIDLIYPQQIINVPVCPNSQCTFSTHIIESGDLFYDLAATYGATTGQILAANVGVDPTTLQVGQQVIVPISCGNFTPSAI